MRYSQTGLSRSLTVTVIAALTAIAAIILLLG